MIRFRNPGTQYTTQVQVFKELYKEYKDAPSFDLDDMASTITKTKLMTAYGYAGDAALALSNTENDSLNSTKMNAKKMLIWFSSNPAFKQYRTELLSEMIRSIKYAIDETIPNFV